MANASRVKVRWFGPRVETKVRDVSRQAMRETALHIMGQAMAEIRANGQIDTGFMLNSGYVVAKGMGDTYAEAVAAAKSRAPNTMAPRAPLKNADALVAFGADYAIWQELKNSFLGAGAQKAIGDPKLKGKLERIFKERVRD